MQVLIIPPLYFNFGGKMRTDKWLFLLAVLGIRDILMRIRIRGSVTLPNGSGPDSFFSDFKDAKKYFFHIFIL
jgi:hypothetical protein